MFFYNLLIEVLDIYAKGFLGAKRLCLDFPYIRHQNPIITICRIQMKEVKASRTSSGRIY